MDGDTPICFYKDDIANYQTTQDENGKWVSNAEYKWIPLMPDPCVNKVKNPNDAGMISFRLSIHDIGRNGDINFVVPGAADDGNMYTIIAEFIKEYS